MRLLLGFVGGLALGLYALPAHAQTAQSTLSFSLVTQISVPGPTGSRIVRLRMGTRDWVESLKEDLGVVGRGGMMVSRRQIDDPNDGGQTWLIVGDQEYLAPEGGPSEITVDLPESFFAEIEAVKLRSDGNEVTGVRPVAFAFGDLVQDGFETTLVGVSTTVLRYVSGAQTEYLGRRSVTKVTGGVVIDDPSIPPEDSDGVVSGTFKYGPEKVVSP